MVSMHKHEAAASGTNYSRCVGCLVPMVLIRKRGSRPYWTARNTARTAILAGPVWEYLNDHAEELAGINRVARLI
jgi:hypothetical protein